MHFAHRVNPGGIYVLRDVDQEKRKLFSDGPQQCRTQWLNEDSLGFRCLRDRARGQ